MNKNVIRYAAVGAGVVAAPIVGPIVAAGLRRWAGGAARRWRQDRADRATRAARAFGGSAEPLPQVLHELELARLAGEIQREREERRPGRLHRVRASTAAYDGALVDACRTVGIEHPRGALPWSDADRYDVEMRLLAAGVHW